MHYLLIYDTAPDYLEKRSQFRAEHLRLAWEAHERGELVLAGALSDPVDGAILLLIARWRIRPWTTVVGKDAGTPIRPEG
jgi:uncharacterized protein YciI